MSQLTNIAVIVEDGETFPEYYCIDCARRMFGEMESAGKLEIEQLYTGANREADSPNHCSSCDELLDFDMTDDGLEYVRQAVVEALTSPTRGAGEDLVLGVWWPTYGAYVLESLDAGVREHLDTLLDAEVVLEHYLVAQLWTGSISWWTASPEFGGEPMASDGLLDNYVSTDDLPEAIRNTAQEDVDSFLESIGDYLPCFPNVGDLTAEQMGHDLSLTRNHHGAGFWDRGLGELGAWLTDVSQNMGECSLYGDVQLIDATLSDPELLSDDNVDTETLSIWSSN